MNHIFYLVGAKKTRQKDFTLPSKFEVQIEKVIDIWLNNFLLKSFIQAEMSKRPITDLQSDDEDDSDVDVDDEFSDEDEDIEDGGPSSMPKK